MCNIERPICIAVGHDYIFCRKYCNGKGANLTRNKEGFIVCDVMKARLKGFGVVGQGASPDRERICLNKVDNGLVLTRRLLLSVIRQPSQKEQQ